MHGAVVGEVALSPVVGAGVAVAVHHHEGTALAPARVTVKRNVGSAGLRPDLVADVVLAVVNQVRLIIAPTWQRAAASSTSAPTASAIPVIVPPATVPVAAVVVSAAPEDIAGVAFHAVASIFDTDDG